MSSKRLLVLLICFAMALVSFAGCGSKTKTGNDTGQPSDSGSQMEEVEIVLWDGVSDSPENRHIFEKRERFSEKFPHIKIRHEQIGAAVGEDRVLYATAMAGGTGPAAYHANYDQLVQKHIRQGFALPLDDYLNAWDEKDNLQDSVMKHAMFDGKTYAIPWQVYVVTMGWNKSLFRRAGLDPEKGPDTWDQMVEYAKLIHDDSTGTYGHGIMGDSVADWWYQYYVWQAGGDITTENEDGTATLHLNEEPAATALQYLQDLKFVHEVTQKDTLSGIAGLMADFCSGKVGMMFFMPEWIPWGVGSYGLDTEQLGMGPAPKGPSGESVTSFGAQFWTINPDATKAQQDAAWEWIKFNFDRYEIERDIEIKIDQNVVYPMVLPLKDMNLSDYTTVNEQWAKNIQQVVENAKFEYYLIETIRPYLSPAIQNALADKNSDVEKILSDAHNLIMKEVIEPYNRDVLGD